jgi:acyl carrier protein
MTALAASIDMAIVDRVRDRVAFTYGVKPENLTAVTSFYGHLESDELELINLMILIEIEFEIEISDDDREALKTVGDLEALVRERRR